MRYLASSASVSIVNFEQVNVYWVECYVYVSLCFFLRNVCLIETKLNEMKIDRFF